MNQHDEKTKHPIGALTGAGLGAAGGFGASTEAQIWLSRSTSPWLKKAIRTRTAVPAGAVIGAIGGHALSRMPADDQQNSLQASSEKLNQAYQNFHDQTKG